jgi:hypothetical protein
MFLGGRPLILRGFRWLWDCRPKGVDEAVFRLDYLHEVVQNHPLKNEEVIVQNNSWSDEMCFLRAAASPNKQIKSTQAAGNPP